MPRETVTIPATQAPPFEAASMLLSYIAYNDTEEKRQRENFAAALTQFMHITTGHFDKTWSHSLQQIRPHIFYAKQDAYAGNLRHGFKRLDYRLKTAYWMLNPYLRTLRGKPPAAVYGFEPTIKHLSIQLKDLFGWDGDNISTFKTKVWGPTRPVCHVAFVICRDMFAASKSAHLRTS